jgi:hypothetical protein
MSSDRSIDRINDIDAADKAKKSSAKPRVGRKRSDDDEHDKQSAKTSSAGSSVHSNSSGGVSRRSRPLTSSAKVRSSDNDDEDSSKQSHSTKSSFDTRSAESETRQSSARRIQQQQRLRKIKETSDVDMNFGEFANDMLDDAAFAPTVSAFPVATTTTTTTTTNSSSIFDAAFSADVQFESAFNTTTETAFGMGMSPFTSTHGMDAFDMTTTPDFGEFSPPINDPVRYDKSPLVDIPKIAAPQLALQHKLIMTKDFLTSPVHNPANGNIVFITSGTNQGVTLHEVDPSRNYIQVTAVPVLSSELRRSVTSKYNASIRSVQKVWTLAVGLLDHHSKLEQIAAIVDFRIVEAATTMRLVLIWQRNYGTSFQLQHVTTPPSGGDFACDLSTLQVSNGLLFVGGTSPKGACVFISKPAVREAWSANFVNGTGSVLAISVAISKPYLVMALADQTVTVWTFKSALVKMAGTDTSQASKRWLFPLCRLNYKDALAAETSVYPGIDRSDEKLVHESGTFLVQSIYTEYLFLL